MPYSDQDHKYSSNINRNIKNGAVEHNRSAAKIRRPQISMDEENSDIGYKSKNQKNVKRPMKPSSYDIALKRVEQKQAEIEANKRRQANIANAQRQAERSRRSSNLEMTKSTVRQSEARKNKQRKSLLLVIIIAVIVVAITLAIVFGREEHPNEVFNPKEETIQKAWSKKDYEKALSDLSQDVFFPGVFINDIDMSGLTAVQGKKLLEEKVQEILSEINISVKAEDKTFNLTAEDIGYSFDTFAALEKAWSIGRSQEHYEDELDLILRHDVVEALSDDPITISMLGTEDETILLSSLRHKLADQLPMFKEAKASGFDLRSQKFIVEPGQMGLEADIDKALQDIHYLLQNKDFRGVVQLKLVEKHPEMTATMIHNNTGLISEASTPVWRSWESDRSKNLKVAAEKITGMVVQPGEIFSYLEAVSPITVENGYSPGGTIVNGVLVDTVGGGLCQPSTTLFQAAAKADLEIIERHNHQIKGSYYDFGQDAMIYGGSADFKFRNDTDYPVAIVGETAPGALIFRLYGRPLPDGVTIELESKKVDDLEEKTETEYIENDKMEPGETKIKTDFYVGSTWETYKVYYKNGQEYDRKYLTFSRYPSLNRKIERGPTVITEPTETESTESLSTEPESSQTSATTTTSTKKTTTTVKTTQTTTSTTKIATENITTEG